MMRALKVIGFDRRYVRAQGPYLFDDQGDRYLDLQSGFGVFALGRNHPYVIESLKAVLDAGLPNLVQFDAPLLAGLLAERIVRDAPPGIEKVCFSNSGTESVEAAIKFSRAATGRDKIVFCKNGFHGLTMGSLSISGVTHFREGFAPFLPGCSEIPFNDLAGLDRALAGRDVAAFVVEPIQGHGVWIPGDDYLPEAQRLCRRHGTLLVADEVQTGLGRTGRLWAVEHWGVEPDLLCMAKALSGGCVPIGAVACRKWIFDKVFNRMDRAAVHGSTFGNNNLAMAAGLATLEVLERERLIDNAARVGRQILDSLRPLADCYELVKEVRGLGMMIGLEFGKPKTLSLKTYWKLLEAANQGLFCQMITAPLLAYHRILSQVAGHETNVVKFLPPLVFSDEDCRWVVKAVSEVIADAHRVPGPLWEFGKRLAGQAIRQSA